MELMIKLCLVLALTFASSFVFAQPSNDLCSGAQSVTPDGTCLGPGLPTTTTTGASDGWIGTVGCAGNNPEVWFTFVATGTELDYTLTAGTMGGNIELIVVESTGPCTGLALVGSDCGASPLTGTMTGLVNGTTYYYTVSNTGAAGTFSACVTTSTPPAVPGQDCNASNVVCDATPFSVGTVASGNGSVAGNASEENLSAISCLLTDERQSQWYQFTAGANGTVEFLVDPNTNANDYDWAIYDITSSGCNLISGGATTVTCNYSGCPGNTGVTTDDPCTLTDYLACAGNPNACNAGDVAQFVTTAPNIVAGNQYAMIIDNFSLANDGFAFSWDTGNMTALLGPQADFSISACAAPNVTVTPTYPNANSGWTFRWDWGDGTNTTANPPLSGSYSHAYADPSINYTISLTVTDPNGCNSATSAISCFALDVDFVDFTVKQDGNNALISWITASEKDSDYFLIQRSYDSGRTFENIGRVDAAGNSSNTLNYQFIDKNPKAGRIYYRIVEYNMDGRGNSTDLKYLELHPEELGVVLTPNPARTSVELSLNDPFGGMNKVRIYDFMGRLMLSKDFSTMVGMNTETINLDDFSKGIYLVEVTNQFNKKRASKLIVD